MQEVAVCQHLPCWQEIIGRLSENWQKGRLYQLFLQQVGECEAQFGSPKCISIADDSLSLCGMLSLCEAKALTCLCCMLP